MNHHCPLDYQIEDQQLLRKACYAEGDIEFGNDLLPQIKRMKSKLIKQRRQQLK